MTDFHIKPPVLKEISEKEYTSEWGLNSEIGKKKKSKRRAIIERFMQKLRLKRIES